MGDLISCKDHLGSILRLDSSNGPNFLEGTIRSVCFLTLSGTGLAKDIVTILVLGRIHGEEWINQSLVVCLLALTRGGALDDTAADGLVILC